MDPGLVKYNSIAPQKHIPLFSRSSEAMKFSVSEEGLTQWAGRHANKPLQILPVDSKNRLADGCVRGRVPGIHWVLGNSHRCEWDFPSLNLYGQGDRK